MKKILTCFAVVTLIGCSTPSPSNMRYATPDASGYHTVQQGETLIRIAISNGQTWRDIMRWNNLEGPDQIQVGQVLRVSPPTNQTENVNPAEKLDDLTNINLSWPVAGNVVSVFDGQINKGVLIEGVTGNPIYSAATGTVQYTGSGLANYPNLVIIKHQNGFLTAYAKTQSVLVKEGDSVSRGQKIAEIGSQGLIQFEIRQKGKPVDPLKFLPSDKNSVATININNSPISASTTKQTITPTQKFMQQIDTTLDEAKKKCTELGFKANTEGFGKCVLQLSK